jgi:RNA polymerase sigma-54 factor
VPKNINLADFKKMVQLSQTMRLEQRLSPQQILLSTLLQLPILNLEQKIQNELEMNPVLEEGVDDEQEQAVESTESISSSTEEEEELQKELALTEVQKDQTDLDIKELSAAQDDTNWDNLINDEDSYEIRLPRDKNEEDYERPEVVIETMTDHLLEQLHFLSLEHLDLKIGEYLILNLRDDGYLDESVTLENVARIFECNENTVEAVLKKIQFFDPVGIAARNLRECLLVQLQAAEDRNELALTIIERHFDDFKNKRYDKIISELNLAESDLRKAIEYISRLNPKPGEGIYNTRHNYIVPDFLVEKVDNEFIVTLNDWNIPPLRINKTYRDLLRSRNKVDKETKQYIRKKIESARWFITSIYQRKITMLNVMRAILQKQFDFFAKGPEHIKPLIMREIAEIINMDISTISRVVNGKYVQTDYGVFELKYFFNEKIETESGEEISTRRVKNRILEMLEKENPKKPLSDEKISAILLGEGFPVARRTVAKYREQLNLPVARLRKKI